MDSKVFPCGSPGKESAHSMGDLGSIPGLGRSPGEWNGYPLQYFGLDNSMDHKTVSLGLALFTLRIMSCVFFVFFFLLLLLFMMVAWHHLLDGHKFEQALGVGDGQGSLVWCSPWGCKDLDMLRDWTELNWIQNNLWSSCIQGNIKEWKNGLQKKARTYIRLWIWTGAFSMANEALEALISVWVPSFFELVT